MSEPIKVLWVNGSLMDRGGISSMMMNYYLNFDPDVISVDFVVHGNGVGERDKEILERGGKVFSVTPKSRNPIANYREIKEIMLNGHYDIVHAHTDSGNAFVLMIAKECGIGIRISHSHNTNYTINNQFRILLNNIQKKLICKYATRFWACSNAAGEWLYGKQARFEVIPNAIDVTRFEYNPIVRDKLRNEYELSNKTVIGHIGRFDYQKNHSFLIASFSEAAKKDENLRLVLVGDGKDRSEIEKTIERLGVQNKVILLGQRTDVDELINMFDVFAFPSRFEGLGMVTIEAQANGLPCVCSDMVTEEANITGNIKYLPIDSTLWVEEFLTAHERDAKSVEKIIDAGYEIHSAAKKLWQRYLELVQSDE